MTRSASTPPVLTIVTVVKDDLEGFRRTVASLEGNDLDRVEFLVIDGSSDREFIPQAIEASPGELRRCTTYAWLPPQGIYPAMNAALARAAGDYIWYVNAGDTLHDESAVASVEFAIAGRPLWAVGRVSFVDEVGGCSVPAVIDFSSEKRHHFARGIFPPHQGTVVSTEQARAWGGFDESYRIAADYALMLRFAAGSTPVLSSDVWGDFREGGLSSVEWRRSITEFHRARREHLSLHGADSLEEYVHTVNHFARQYFYKNLLAPDRPLGCIWAKVPRRGDRGVTSASEPPSP